MVYLHKWITKTRRMSLPMSKHLHCNIILYLEKTIWSEEDGCLVKHEINSNIYVKTINQNSIDKFLIRCVLF